MKKNIEAGHLVEDKKLLEEEREKRKQATEDICEKVDINIFTIDKLISIFNLYFEIVRTRERSEQRRRPSTSALAGDGGAGC